ncbi:UNVERIFIED_CONTAM: hypothetical protein Sradi_6009600 [Sesamum radiatum]|uniref:SUF system FeS cluster assembly SufBD core domain-containing protein n=1 Tax=Sesamum radiatum TaxID=300843 RepID=A0AAW2KHI8_SESRA
MAALLTNGISPFSSQPVSELSKGSSLHFTSKSLVYRNPSSRTSFKIRADVGYEPKTTIDSPGKKSSDDDDPLQKFLKRDYKWGFTQEIDSFSIPKGLSEETIRLISSRKGEPDWMLEFRLKSYEKFFKMKEPKWYFDKLGVPLNERNRLANVAVDAVLDSVSIATTHRKTLEKSGVIFCSISEAIREINAMETGQFERTLIVADEGSFVEYLEGCTAPSYDTNQLHAAVVELYCHTGAEIKYSTVQNWYAGDEEGRGGIFNFVTKRGLCAGPRSKISWTQVETGSAITWKYPSVILEGDDSVGEFYSVALTNNYQQADTGTKMIHKGKNTRSRIISKGISAGHSRNCYRGLVQVMSNADKARNSSQCDSMLIGDKAAANTYPYIQTKNPTARIEHEATTSKIGEDQLFYFQQRGIDYEKAMAAMISGFCRDVFNELPDEFGAEVNQLMSLKLEGSVG